MDTRNLRAELERRDISRRQVAQALNMKDSPLNCRMRGKIDFRVEELITIRDKFLPTFPLDYLAGATPTQRMNNETH